MRPVLALVLLAATGCGIEGADPEGAEAEQRGAALDWRRPVGGRDFILGASTIASGRVVAHGNYLSLDLSFGPFDQLRKSIESAANASLKNRGEAHVTIITPPESSTLTRKVSVREMESLASRATFKVTPRCVGVGVARDLETVYVVVDAPELVALRQEIHDLYVSRGGADDAFDPDAFKPHVTLGFTQRDLFEEDGVVKDVSSCPRPKGLQVLP